MAFENDYLSDQDYIVANPTSPHINGAAFVHVGKQLKSAEKEAFFRKVLEENPHTLLRAIAAIQLGIHYIDTANRERNYPELREDNQKKAKKLFKKSRSLLKRLSPHPIVLDYLFEVENSLEKLRPQTGINYTN